jgi:hypothetical protein
MNACRVGVFSPTHLGSFFGPHNLVFIGYGKIFSLYHKNDCSNYNDNLYDYWGFPSCACMPPRCHAWTQGLYYLYLVWKLVPLAFQVFSFDLMN